MTQTSIPSQAVQTAWQRTATWLRPILHSKQFHLTMIYLVLFDLVLVVIDLILSLYASCVPGEDGTCTAELKESVPLSAGKAFLYWLSISILLIFVLEVILSVAVFGRKYLLSPIVTFDALVILTALGELIVGQVKVCILTITFATKVTELYFHFSGLEESGANAVIILRILKIVRGMHAVAHAAAFEARERVEELEKINRHIADRAMSMNRALTLAHQQVESLFESLNPLNSKESKKVRGQISAIYEHLKGVVQSGELDLEVEIESLLMKEGETKEEIVRSR
ncbi:hypothetical protein BC830DRAFT_1079465 [Chytriomyces sp. MP71]|nr:hypothetical protein BC830DRAFT_1079465 [Chytriomyces sp. MP71]